MPPNGTATQVIRTRGAAAQQSVTTIDTTAELFRVGPDSFFCFVMSTAQKKSSKNTQHDRRSVYYRSRSRRLSSRRPEIPSSHHSTLDLPLLCRRWRPSLYLFIVQGILEWMCLVREINCCCEDRDIKFYSTTTHLRTRIVEVFLYVILRHMHTTGSTVLLDPMRLR